MFEQDNDSMLNRRIVCHRLRINRLIVSKEDLWKKSSFLFILPYDYTCIIIYSSKMSNLFKTIYSFTVKEYLPVIPLIH